MSNLNKITPEIIERLGLIKTDASDGVSFAADCTFWKVGDTGIWITDYDMNWDSDRSIEEANLLTRENLISVFSRILNTKTVMSYEILLWEDALDIIINSVK